MKNQFQYYCDVLNHGSNPNSIESHINDFLKIYINSHQNRAVDSVRTLIRDGSFITIIIYTERIFIDS